MLEEKNLNPEPVRNFFKESLFFIWELAKIVLVSLAIIIPVRYFLIQPFYVKGASMEPNFEDHQYLIVDELSYRFRAPERGEVVVFRYPLSPKDHFIKRIIGLPGDKLEFNDNEIKVYNKQFPDGLVLKEPYITRLMTAKMNKTVLVGDNEFYLLGDNRPESMDSRSFGAVKKSAITGRVFFRGWPIDKVGFFWEAPSYN